MVANGLKSNPGGSFVAVGKTLVYGKGMDGLTRCAHYHSAVDILAIKFPCCNKYYPCHSCHEEFNTHAGQVWPTSRFNEVAIPCGACGGTEHTIEKYLADPTRCHSCKARFNPNCTLHHHLYFEK